MPSLLLQARETPRSSLQSLHHASIPHSFLCFLSSTALCAQPPPLLGSLKARLVSLSVPFSPTMGKILNGKMLCPVELVQAWASSEHWTPFPGEVVLLRCTLSLPLSESLLLHQPLLPTCVHTPVSALGLSCFLSPLYAES